jgi:hypothetical protein
VRRKRIEKERREREREREREEKEAHAGQVFNQSRQPEQRDLVTPSAVAQLVDTRHKAAGLPVAP